MLNLNRSLCNTKFEKSNVWILLTVINKVIDDRMMYLDENNNKKTCRGYSF